MNQTLIAYFSASGTTATVANNLAKAIEADIYEIKPKVAYTRADLDWMNKKSRSTIEMQDKSSRPELADTNADIKNYNTIFLGFPIWWYIAPTIINTFLESYDFSGKKVIFFATSGGSGLGKTIESLRDSVSTTTQLIEGKVLNKSQTVEELKIWANSF